MLLLLLLLRGDEVVDSKQHGAVQMEVPIRRECVLVEGVIDA